MTETKAPSDLTSEQITPNAELIAEALKAAERESWGGDKRYAFLFHNLATRLHIADESLSTATAALKEADEALIALADGAELVSAKTSIVQPFLSIYKKHGAAIESARERRRLGAQGVENG